MFKRSEISKAVGMALAASAGLSSAPAMAVLEEITVTATKRATALQDTPIAVQPLSQEKLD
jgi:iron complex outermembrane receptor protein